MDTTPIKKTLFNGSMTVPNCETFFVRRFEYDPIAGGATKVLELPVDATKGLISGIKVQCDSTNFDIYVYPNAVTDRQSIMTIYEKTGINKKSVEYLDPATAPVWCKYSQADLQSSPTLRVDSSIYLELENKGGDTGPVYVELTFMQLQ